MIHYSNTCFSAHSITSDVDLVDTAHAAEFFLSDGVIITGTATGRPVDTQELQGRAYQQISVGPFTLRCDVP